ncbi:MAG TPA: hypothetical protein VMS01_04300 [Stellaceae bacterium]|nr:hypothetical protein [Stellaceae bacterium]
MFGFRRRWRPRLRVTALNHDFAAAQPHYAIVADHELTPAQMHLVSRAWHALAPGGSALIIDGNAEILSHRLEAAIAELQGGTELLDS